MDVETGGNISNILLGGTGISAVAWAIYEKIMRHKVESASAGSEVAVANANEALFGMLTNRLEALESDVQRLRAELAKEREYTRMLISTIIEAGLKPPSYPVV